MRVDACPWEAVKILDKMNPRDISSISDAYEGTRISSSLVQARLEKYKRPTLGKRELDENYFFFAKSEEEFLTKVFVYEIHDV